MNELSTVPSWEPGMLHMGLPHIYNIYDYNIMYDYNIYIYVL